MTATEPPGTEPDLTDGGRRARGSLSEDTILRGAKDLVERDGLQQLSMPALAKELGSGVTSIYWYFRSKDELLRALTDQVTREMYRELPPVGNGPWDDELTEYFVAFRDLLEGTPIYREVFAYRAHLLLLQAAMGPAMLRRLEAGLSLFHRAGLDPDQAAEAFTACANYTRGFVVLEHGLEREDIDEGTSAALRRLGRDEFPMLSEVEDFEQIMGLDDEQFRFGLRLLIEGIRRRYTL